MIVGVFIYRIRVLLLMFWIFGGIKVLGFPSLPWVGFYFFGTLFSLVSFPFWVFSIRSFNQSSFFVLDLSIVFFGASSCTFYFYFRYIGLAGFRDNGSANLAGMSLSSFLA